MNKTTKIKTVDPMKRKITIMRILYVVLSIAIGFLISFYGTGNSFIEESFISCSLTLFGFDLTSVVFVYSVLRKYTSSNTQKIADLQKKIAKSIKLILILILGSIAMDFIATIFYECFVINLIISTFKYSMLLYSLICQIDVINTFLILIKEIPESNEAE